MYFTREPIIETIITPKEGHKLLLRSSKTTGQEEYYVDAVEVISFERTLFFRSLEKPKAFLLPVADYEVLEVREARMVLKGIGVEKGIKIGGGRDTVLKTSKGEDQEGAPRVEKKRDRKRGRKKKTKEEVDQTVVMEEAKIQERPLRGEEPRESTQADVSREKPASALIPPPTTLISETLARYKDTPVYAGAFFEKQEAAEEEFNAPSEEKIELEPPTSPQEEEEAVEDKPEEREEPMVHEQANPASQNANEKDEDLPF